ncbi:MAG: FKBP-type peptidyl-prolyl cis-trans isomerase family protein [Candidatus Xenolissoclinum pacificiensis L6]|uniref:Trigger factor n=1 Tax=Candidatus Xenolissoclinum pacificiensis L6 TaxID=1401685 RepID=W2UZT8_9RICK|nr:MAG: FKBP-type peptidyl-prolyl cis-trans isomerase family protein [Candidatus Xenolissoclinum pacificiensis L6]
MMKNDTDQQLHSVMEPNNDESVEPSKSSEEEMLSGVDFSKSSEKSDDGQDVHSSQESLVGDELVEKDSSYLSDQVVDKGDYTVTEYLEVEKGYKKYRIFIKESKVQADIDAYAMSSSKKGFRKESARRSISVDLMRSIVASSIQQSIPKICSEIVQEESLDISSQPDVEIVQGPTDNNYNATYDILFELNADQVPIIEPGDITLNVTKGEVTDEELKEYVKEVIRSIRKKEEVVDDQYQAKVEDELIINFDGKINNKRFKGGMAQNVHVTLGKQQVIKDMEDGLLGMQVGQEKDICVAFPDDYHNPLLRKKKALFRVSVLRVLKSLPVTEDSEVLSSLKCKDHQEVSDNAKKVLEHRKQMEFEDILRESIYNAIKDKYDFNVPESLIDSEVGRIKLDSAFRDVSDEMIREKAIGNAKLSLLLLHYAKSQDIKTSQEDVMRRVFEMSGNDDQKLEKIVSLYKDNQEMIMQLSNQILEEKVFKDLKSKVNVNSEL